MDIITVDAQACCFSQPLPMCLACQPPVVSPGGRCFITVHAARCETFPGGRQPPAFFLAYPATSGSLPTPDLITAKNRPVWPRNLVEAVFTVTARHWSTCAFSMTATFSSGVWMQASRKIVGTLSMVLKTLGHDCAASATSPSALSFPLCTWAGNQGNMLYHHHL